MHDDNNGVISLGCWTHLTESNALISTEARLDHLSFVKPEVEYLATHVLSNLPCEVDDDDWSMNFVALSGLRDDIELVPIVEDKGVYY